ncbi:MAG: hypothetical protein AB1758_33935, partial [Candidatus Eremiobacterota bacterium]
SLPPDSPEVEALSALEHGLEVIGRGYEMIWEGLELMSRYPEDQNQARLMEAVRRTWQGFQHLYDFQRSIEAAAEVSDGG